MSHATQMSIKLDTALRDDFMAVANHVVHRPAAQIIRELMRAFIAHQEIPNATTIAAIEAVERNDVITYSSAEEFYQKMGI